MKEQSENPKNPYLDVRCTDISNHLADAGEFYTDQQARGALNAYFDLPDTPVPTDPKHLYAHTYGINKMRELLFNIDQYNEKVTDPKQLIQGVRLYFAFDVRNDSYFPLPEGKPFRDLLFMPVTANGADLDTKNTKEDAIPIPDHMILAGSRPCPPQCTNLCFFNF